MKEGFSLPELVAVIVIIGILATLGVNSYRSFIANGRQAEAKLNLKAIADLQETYKYEKENYHAEGKTTGVGAFGTNPKTRCTKTGNYDGEYMKNELGFRPSNCEKLRYGYWWTKGTATQSYEDAEAYAESTEIDGKYIYPGCKQTDKWTLEIKKKEMHQGKSPNVDVDSVIKKCE